MKIDLRTLPTVVTGARKFEDRRKRIAGYLDHLEMMKPEFISCELHGKKRLSSITLTHLAAVSGREGSFILFEDDATPTDWFKPVIDVPDDADAVWLGTSPYGPAPSRNEYSNAALVWGDPVLPRVANMFGCHAILIIKDTFRHALARKLFTLLCTKPNLAHDWATADLQRDFKCYGCAEPMFWQDDMRPLCVTKGSLAVAVQDISPDLFPEDPYRDHVRSMLGR